MTIYELFERHFADQHGYQTWEVKRHRMQNGSYRESKIATAFRMFKAGFEANQGEKMRVIGYLSAKEVQGAEDGEETYLCKIPMPGVRIGVFVKQCDPLKTGDEA
jgi:hypothetical protein